LKTISYGKERPVVVCDDISCWSQNRRAVTVLNGAGSQGKPGVKPISGSGGVERKLDVSCLEAFVADAPLSRQN
jgi:hypothetical protein